MNSIYKTMATFVFISAINSPVSALQPATDKVIFSITGNIGEKNTSNAANFDLAMIEKMPQKTFTTLTPWDKQPIQFTGPLLRDILSAVKSNGSTLNVTALNDYKTSIPVTDANNFDVILAYKINGQLIPIKTKGPLFIIYPFDAHEKLQSKAYYERSAWQLKSMHVE